MEDYSEKTTRCISLCLAAVAIAVCGVAAYGCSQTTQNYDTQYRVNAQTAQLCIKVGSRYVNGECIK